MKSEVQNLRKLRDLKLIFSKISQFHDHGNDNTFLEKISLLRMTGLLNRGKPSSRSIIHGGKIRHRRHKARKFRNTGTIPCAAVSVSQPASASGIGWALRQREPGWVHSAPERWKVGNPPYANEGSTCANGRNVHHLAPVVPNCGVVKRTPKLWDFQPKVKTFNWNINESWKIAK